jgi:hypothetical protein
MGGVHHETKKTVLRIRIRFDLALLDPDLYWECGYRSRSKKIDKKKTKKILISSLSKWLFFTYLGVFYGILLK